MAIPAFLAASMVISTIGSIYAGEQEGKGYEAESADLRLRANEMRSRNAENNEQIDLAAQEVFGSQVAATASGGAEVSSGSALTNYATTFRKAAVEKANALRAVNFETSQMEKSAASKLKLAKSIRKASYLGAAGKLSAGLYDYSKEYKSSTPTSTALPKQPSSGSMPSSVDSSYLSGKYNF